MMTLSSVFVIVSYSGSVAFYSCSNQENIRKTIQSFADGFCDRRRHCLSQGHCILGPPEVFSRSQGALSTVGRLHSDPASDTATN
ncbi:hypothetical protein B0T26DRAFT_721856 [Lasiosphaeria miniovina]|uniref:Secreted protein n=1 Tax=Lasiosphaeria miniovina TaxID=1954250 RepID=A0AA40DMU3_9PEZI|nr:uncharacterized protein B0T26DRAFT_721856 [Lasiosphaeria miniovina]KAK0709519.1 hypothetical protein B0T26DRAFT_721856 [Lasiosphaeria miniovina]